MTLYSEYQNCPLPPRETQGAASVRRLEPTGQDILGPFWLPGSPARRTLVENPTLHLFGLVMDTEGTPLAGALLDFWQADAQGKYDETGPGFRGRQEADREGCYNLFTIKPGDYKISDPGQPEQFRCAHIHVKVDMPGYRKLTTQLYFDHSAHNDEDHWFDPKRVVHSTRNPSEVMFTFVLAREDPIPAGEGSDDTIIPAGD